MMNEYIINEENINKRLDVFLNEIYPNFSRSGIQKNIKNGFVKVNNKIEKSSYKLKQNDTVKYTLVNALLYKYGENGLSDSNNDKLRPGIVHRLDRNTSGLLLVAKTNKAYEFLTKQIKDKTAIRRYKAIVEGVVEKDSGEIKTFFGRDKKHKEKMAVWENEGKEAITLYKVIERFKNYTFVEYELKTGRTHQIRVHSKYINHPIVNDSLYGAKKFKVKTTEQVLQAYSLCFMNLKNEIIEIKIDEDEDLQKVLRYLRSKK